jgi:hypothetical protein
MNGIHGIFAAYPMASGPQCARCQAMLINNGGAGTPYVTGATHIVGWNQVEAVHGVYNWSGVDALLAAWWAGGKPSGLLLCPTSYNGNTWTPSWYSSANQMFQGGNGNLPVFWSSAFTTAWQTFLAAAVARYGADQRVAYLRTGFIGFENYADKNAGQNNAVMSAIGYSESVWCGAVESMATYCAGLSPKFQFSVNFDNYGTKATSFPLGTSAYAAGLGMALCSAGLQASDLTAAVTSNDSFAVFAAEQGTVALGQQTVSLSELPGENWGMNCGPLAPLLPFATSRGTTFFELFTQDVLAAFDSQSSRYQAAQQAGYPGAIKTAFALIG